MQFNKFINRSSSSPLKLSLVIFLLHSIFLIKIKGDSGDILNSDDVENKENHRESKQLFSMLKNILQQAQKPQPQYQQQQQFQNLNPYQTDPYYNQYPVGGVFNPAAQQKIHTGVADNTGSAISDPNYQSQYPMQNYELKQHSSVPYYNENLQLQSYQQQHQLYLQQQQMQQQLQQQQQSVGGVGGLGSSQSASSINPVLLSQGANILSKFGLGIPEDLDLSTISNLINFGAFEGMLGRVNQFDKLQCIPRMICQMVAKRNEDQALRDSTSTTTSTTTTTERPKSTKKPKKRSREESGRFIKIGGVDTALDQFVKFLDLMQLKDWSIYPYVKGMYEGNQVQRSGECAQKFNSCPFSDDQLVYYFNNYNGGLFQSFRSGRNLLDLNVNDTMNSTSSRVNKTSRN